MTQRLGLLRHLGALALVSCSWSCSVTAQTAAATAVTSAACAGPEHRQLDFWLGRWQVRWEAAAGLPAGSGTNTVSREYGGCVVQEAFAGGPATNGLLGHSVSGFHSPSGRWRQTWVDNQGGHFVLTGGPQGERFVLVASRPGDGTPVQRMVYEAITERSLTWRWQATTDAGQTWSDRWVIHYTRLPEPAPAAEAVPPSALFAVEIKTGPAWEASKPPQAQAHFSAHSAHLRRLREQGVLQVGARYADKGLLVLRAASEADAHALLRDDPSLQAGVFKYELHEFRPFYGGTLTVPPRPR